MSQLVPFSVYDDGRLYSYTVKFLLCDFSFAAYYCITSQCDAWFSALYKYTYLLTYYLLTYLLTTR